MFNCGAVWWTKSAAGGRPKTTAEGWQSWVRSTRIIRTNNVAVKSRAGEPEMRVGHKSKAKLQPFCRIDSGFHLRASMLDHGRFDFARGCRGRQTPTGPPLPSGLVASLAVMKSPPSLSPTTYRSFDLGPAEKSRCAAVCH